MEGGFPHPPPELGRDGALPSTTYHSPTWREDFHILRSNPAETELCPPRLTTHPRGGRISTSSARTRQRRSSALHVLSPTRVEGGCPYPSPEPGRDGALPSTSYHPPTWREDFPPSPRLRRDRPHPSLEPGRDGSSALHVFSVSNHISCSHISSTLSTISIFRRGKYKTKRWQESSRNMGAPRSRTRSGSWQSLSASSAGAIRGMR